jgi:competence/damage-inducible protein CinA-like protein
MKEVLAEIITIGDEILYGHIIDTNAQWMSTELDQIGVKVLRKTTIGDQEDQMLTAFTEAEARVDLVLMTGGLGPTNDDITMPTLAKFFNCEVVQNMEVYEHVKHFFESRGLPFNAPNKKQALVPEIAKILPNELGTAPVTWLERNNTIFVSMPGVPYEMKNIMHASVLPKVQEFFNTPFIYHRIIKTVGIGESFLAEKIKDWEENLPDNVSLAYLPSIGQVKLRLTAKGDNENVLKALVQNQINLMLPIAQKYIYGYDKISFEEAIGNLLIEKNKSIAFAESCSGGYVQHKITKVRGSSKYFQGGIVPYHNELKINLLGVKQETIEQYGAVSEECVVEMANQVREKFNADIGAASSGVAGPDGGSDEKPVGTIWIAYADGKQTVTKKLQLTQNRVLNIELTEISVLNLVRKSLTL